MIEAVVPPTEHIFVRASGEPIHPELFTERLRAVIASANTERSDQLPNVSLHGLRHSYASALLASGEHLTIVQAAMRHSSIRVTSDVYGHLASNAVADVNERLAERIGGG